MYVSNESKEETEARILSVLARCELRVFDGLYTFEEYPVAEFPIQRVGEALAFTRDEDVWSALVPCANEDAELFGLFSFHFPEGLDNSGFVGWLASHLKERLGTGIFVVCGQNSREGGVFDYWGSPCAMKEKVIDEVRRLIQEGRRRQAGRE